MNKMIVMILSSALALTSQLATADDYEAEHLIEYRQHGMNAIKHHNNSIKLILQDKVPQSSELDMHVDSLGKLMHSIGNWFPEGSDFGETNAKDGIWDKPEKFDQAVKDGNTAFDELKAVLAKGDRKTSAKALKQFGKNSCGSCHKKFKKKDN